MKTDVSWDDCCHSDHDHHPNGLEDVNVDMDCSVDPVFWVISFWDGNAAHIEGDIEANWESESKSDGEIWSSGNLAFSSGLLFNNNDQESHKHEWDESSDNHRSLNGLFLSVPVKSKPQTVDANSDGKEKYHPEMRVPPGSLVGSNESSDSEWEKSKERTANHGLTSVVLVNEEHESAHSNCDQGEYKSVWIC